MSKSWSSRDAQGLAPVARRWLAHWPEWVGYAAAAWSLIYGLLGLYWAWGGEGFPFGAENDPDAAENSVLAGARAASAAPEIAVLGVCSAFVALTMARKRRSGAILRGALLGFAWLTAVVLALVIPDYRVLAAAAYAPLYVAGAPFGWPPVNYFDVALPWPVINQFLCIGGGLLWAGAALAYHRRVRGACGNCGRSASRAGWTAPETAARWGRWAVYVSFVVPVLYAVTRGAWALGIPLGISDGFLGWLQTTGLVWAGAGLAAVAVGGAVLTLGLVQRWGEVFPGWIPLLSKRRVPVWLAVVPASLVSVLVTTAGLMYVRLLLNGTVGEHFGIGMWAVIVPELLWPLWGAALGAATLAYYYRRRDRCGVCGRGKDGPIRRQAGAGQ